MSDNYGQAVMKSDADRYFKNFYDIKKRSQKKLKEALKGDKEALRYYCGDKKIKKQGCDQDWAFVFDEASIKRLLAKLKKHGGNCVFIFNGAKEDGSPTVMLLPSTYREVAAKQQREEFSFLIHSEEPPKKSRSAAAAKAMGAAPDAAMADSKSQIAGEQHPGHGGGSFKRGEAIGIPGGFYEGEYTV